MSFCVAVDGPAGAGKSTIARRVARRLELIYVDTGAMYRAMAVYMLRAHVDPEAGDAIDDKCREADIDIRYEQGEQVVYLNGENVNAFLRTEETGNMASAIALRKKVRTKLVEQQKKLAKSADVIMDGRDIGTCVLPDAQVKIYLTASIGVRAKRRFDELAAKGEACDIKKIEEDIAERDERDMNREVSPLKQADDAVLIDTSDMTVEEVVERIVRICEAKRRD